jgi:hypothetical protein
MSATQTVKAMEALLRCALLAGLAFDVLNQVRKPTRWVGGLFLWIMNSSHSGVTDRGLKHVESRGISEFWMWVAAAGRLRNWRRLFRRRDRRY